MTDAERILSKAYSDPGSALESGESYLETLDTSDHAERSATLRAMSLAARTVARIEDSVDLARQAIASASAGGNERLRLLGVLTLTGSLAMSGRRVEALDYIEDAIATASDAEIVAKFKFQRSAVLRDLGRLHDAAAALESVLVDFRRLDDRPSILLTLNGLGQSLIALGRLDEAETHLREAIVLAVQLDDNSTLPGIEHNVGQLEYYRGDIPAALDWLQRSDEHYMALSGSSAPQHVTRSQVLSSVGLYSEAQDLATAIARERRKRGDMEHATNALLVAAEAALAGNGFGPAHELTGEVLELIEGETGSLRYAQARRLSAEARLAFELPSRDLLDEVTSIAEELAGLGQMVASGQANLLAARVAGALSDARAARSCLNRVPTAGSGPVEVRFQSYLARSLLRIQDGNVRGAAAAVRSGLELLDEYQAALGASDLRSGIERQGAELAEIGLRLAVESSRPRRVLEWLDRTRARALRYQPVVMTGEDAVTEAVVELRQVEAELRKPENHYDRGLNRKRRRLQQDIAGADRLRRETRLVGGRFSVDNLIDSLADRTLLELGRLDGNLFGVLVRRGRARHVEIGDEEAVVNELGHIRFGMRRAARRGRPADLKSLERLDRMLFDRVDLGAEVIIVPPPSMMAVPWSALPSLRGRSLTVSPSAEMWWRARQAESPKRHVLVAGGPDLEFAGSEVEAVGSLYPSPTVLPPDAKVEDVRSGLAGAMTAHIVSHATFQVENPMFSSLRLGDGDLNVYDIERLDDPPGVVVLSACDSGYTETRAGDELAGLTSALLSMGTRSVVASVGLVPDSVATSALMVRFHEGLIRGLEPAAALAAARAGSSDDPADFVAASSFICVGA